MAAKNYEESSLSGSFIVNDEETMERSGTIPSSEESFHTSEVDNQSHLLDGQSYDEDYSASTPTFYSADSKGVAPREGKVKETTEPTPGRRMNSLHNSLIPADAKVYTTFVQGLTEQQTVEIGADYRSNGKQKTLDGTSQMCDITSEFYQTKCGVTAGILINSGYLNDREFISSRDKVTNKIDWIEPYREEFYNIRSFILWRDLCCDPDPNRSEVIDFISYHYGDEEAPYITFHRDIMEYMVTYAEKYEDLPPWKDMEEIALRLTSFVADDQGLIGGKHHVALYLGYELIPIYILMYHLESGFGYEDVRKRQGGLGFYIAGFPEVSAETLLQMEASLTESWDTPRRSEYARFNQLRYPLTDHDFTNRLNHVHGRVFPQEQIGAQLRSFLDHSVEYELGSRNKTSLRKLQISRNAVFLENRPRHSQGNRVGDNGMYGVGALSVDPMINMAERVLVDRISVGTTDDFLHSFPFNPIIGYTEFVFWISFHEKMMWERKNPDKFAPLVYPPLAESVYEEVKMLISNNKKALYHRWCQHIVTLCKAATRGRSVPTLAQGDSFQLGDDQFPPYTDIAAGYYSFIGPRNYGLTVLSAEGTFLASPRRSPYSTTFEQIGKWGRPQWLHPAHLYCLTRRQYPWQLVDWPSDTIPSRKTVIDLLKEFQAIDKSCVLEDGVPRHVVSDSFIAVPQQGVRDGREPSPRVEDVFLASDVELGSAPLHRLTHTSVLTSLSVGTPRGHELEATIPQSQFSQRSIYDHSSAVSINPYPQRFSQFDIRSGHEFDTISELDDPDPRISALRGPVPRVFSRAGSSLQLPPLANTLGSLSHPVTGAQAGGGKRTMGDERPDERPEDGAKKKGLRGGNPRSGGGDGGFPSDDDESSMSSSWKRDKGPGGPGSGGYGLGKGHVRSDDRNRDVEKNERERTNTREHSNMGNMGNNQARRGEQDRKNQSEYREQRSNERDRDNRGNGRGRRDDDESTRSGSQVTMAKLEFVRRMVTHLWEEVFDLNRFPFGSLLYQQLELEEEYVVDEYGISHLKYPTQLEDIPMIRKTSSGSLEVDNLHRLMDARFFKYSVNTERTITENSKADIILIQGDDSLKSCYLKRETKHDPKHIEEMGGQLLQSLTAIFGLVSLVDHDFMTEVIDLNYDVEVIKTYVTESLSLLDLSKPHYEAKLRVSTTMCSAQDYTEEADALVRAANEDLQPYLQQFVVEQEETQHFSDRELDDVIDRVTLGLNVKLKEHFNRMARDMRRLDEKKLQENDPNKRLQQIKTSQARGLQIIVAAQAVNQVKTIIHQKVRNYMSVPDNVPMLDFLKGRQMKAGHRLYTGMKFNGSKLLIDDFSKLWSLLVGEFSTVSISNILNVFKKMVISTKTPPVGTTFETYTNGIFEARTAIHRAGVEPFFTLDLHSALHTIEGWQDEDVKIAGLKVVQEVLNDVKSSKDITDTEIQEKLGSDFFQSVITAMSFEASLRREAGIVPKLQSTDNRRYEQSRKFSKGYDTSGAVQAHAVMTPELTAKIKADAVHEFTGRPGFKATVKTLFKKATQVGPKNGVGVVWKNPQYPDAAVKVHSYTSTRLVCSVCGDSDPAKHHQPRCSNLQCTRCKDYGHIHSTCLQEI